MTHKDQTNPMTVNAIIWAALMIATSLIMADVDNDQKEFLVLLQFVGWYTVNLSLMQSGKSFKSEWVCLRRRFGRRKQV